MEHTDRADITIKVRGDFGFSLNGAIQQVLARYPSGERAFIVDLAEAQDLDSSALGMLLQLRSHSRDSVCLTLLNPSQPVRALLEQAPIGALLVVEHD